MIKSTEIRSKIIQECAARNIEIQYEMTEKLYAKSIKGVKVCTIILFLTFARNHILLLTFARNLNYQQWSRQLGINTLLRCLVAQTSMPAFKY